MAATHHRRCTGLVACALALATLLAPVIGSAATADTTRIGVSPEQDSVSQGETTTVDIVVENADGGVGALNATITLSDPDVASIERVTLQGDPNLSGISRRDDGVEVSAALADTDDTGSVTIATVVVRGDAPGESEIQVDVRALGDEDGAPYSVVSTESPTLTVTESESSDPDTPSQTTTETPNTGDGDPDEDPTTEGPGGTTTPGDQSAISSIVPLGVVIAVGAIVLLALGLYRLR